MSIWLSLAFRVPLVLLVGLLIWWVSRSGPDEPSSSDEDGGIRRHSRHGPHGGLGGMPPAPPARVRTTRARARSFGH
jgi:hypothetical protein